MSTTGSTLGGEARGSYPLPGSTRVGTGSRRKLEEVEGLGEDDDGGGGGGVEKISFRAPKPELELDDAAGDGSCSCLREEDEAKDRTV